jgi:hypothetical protein
MGTTASVRRATRIDSWFYTALLLPLAMFIGKPVYSKPAENSPVAIATARDYCASTQHSILLNANRTVLCFDGVIDEDLDVGIFNNLKEHGLFVIRSPGGDRDVAERFSNILRAKDATVVLYDYCFSACANYVLIATDRTYVTKGTIIAWHTHTKTSKWHWETDCRGYYDPSSQRFRDHSTWGRHRDCTGMPSKFFADRQIQQRHIYVPPTLHTRKMVSAAINQTLDKYSVFWMWHPKNQGDYFKSRITYEAYPTEDEVAAFVTRRSGQLRIIYDPEE